VLNALVPVFDMGRSYRNVRPEKRPENVWKRSWKTLEIYIQNCVGTLQYKKQLLVMLFIVTLRRKCNVPSQNDSWRSYSDYRVWPCRCSFLYMFNLCHVCFRM